jgi:hypothetical protein
VEPSCIRLISLIEAPCLPHDGFRTLEWPLVIPVWFTCVILSGYFPCKVTIDSILRDTLGYG